MTRSIYRSGEGREKIERFYEEVLGRVSEPFTRHRIPTGSGDVHVLRFGEDGKPPLVFLHGTMSNSMTWLGSVRYFLDDFRVFCVDIPGEPGLSSPVRLPLGSPEAYGWLTAVLDGLGIAACPIVAMSLGSWYALNFAIHEPARVEALSLITTSGISPARGSFILKALFYMFLGKRGREKLNALIYHKEPVDPLADEFSSLASRYVIPLTDPIPLFPDSVLSGISLPVQYFGGECDALLDTGKTAERLAAFIPDCEVNILKDTGHVILNQEAQILRFLKKRAVTESAIIQPQT